MSDDEQAKQANPLEVSEAYARGRADSIEEARKAALAIVAQSGDLAERYTVTRFLPVRPSKAEMRAEVLEAVAKAAEDLCLARDWDMGKTVDSYEADLVAAVSKARGER